MSADIVRIINYGGTVFSVEEIDEILEAVKQVSPVFAFVLEGELDYRYEEATHE